MSQQSLSAFSAAVTPFAVAPTASAKSSTLSAHAPSRYEFVQRHLGPSEVEQKQMLAALGLKDLSALYHTVLPASLLLEEPIALPSGLSEEDAQQRLQAIAANNQLLTSFIGMGFYNTHTPAVIQRNVFENPAWYTAYTPYQPEISQGRLEALLNFQTMVSDLTGLPLANASLLDEASACAEAMLMCQRMSKSSSRQFFVAQDCHPQNIAVLQTRAEPLGIDIIIGDPAKKLGEQEVFGALLQYPGTYGHVNDLSDFIAEAHSQNALVAVAADLLALCCLTPPGEMGADVAIGNTQRFGVPLGYGGPHAAYMATHERFKRALPGRLIGVSKDQYGQLVYRLALQTREQHIRREKATSNICTAQALLAVMASMYAVYHGAEGLKNIALRVHRFTQLFVMGIKHLGYEVVPDMFFDTVTFLVVGQAQAIHKACVAQGYNLRPINDNTIGVSFDETTRLQDVMLLWWVLQTNQAGLKTTQIKHNSAFQSFNACHANHPRYLHEDVLCQALEPGLQKLDKEGFDAIGEPLAMPAELLRQSTFLTHPTFNSYHSETKLMRYLRGLADKDLALDRAMIPLGSCTMKLNAASELMPVSWPEFAQLHPFVPLNQAQGYQTLFDELQTMLCAITGYAAVSLQPNSGAQGEYAGLLAIRAYHRSCGQHQRQLCFIPASAHGTNPASAQMAGLQVVVIKTNLQGEIDNDDLETKLTQFGDQLAAMMITYPSTHGVFEHHVKHVCDRVHQVGGQVYIDGANFNAMVGLAKPGEFGGDVSHFNLHKTFAIPHGGGGPGVGPIGVAKHLAPFLPSQLKADAKTPREEPLVGPVNATSWGSASILPVSWSYLVMLGQAGLGQASLVAILNANYIAKRLAPFYAILYTDEQGWIAHECILDVRPFKASSGIDVDDIAKRLIDYGFHAPTMSFPVPGTLMIEPTESESKAEIDRFCDAMIAIRHEIDAITQGTIDALDNPLKNAPHTAKTVTRDDWPHVYSRQQAAFPQKDDQLAKYWPPVSRVDNVHGDRHLVCSCPPVSAYKET